MTCATDHIISNIDIILFSLVKVQQQNICLDQRGSPCVLFGQTHVEVELGFANMFPQPTDVG